jgi:hypothetical protein
VCPPPPARAQGVWGFFSPCTAAANPNQYTTSMVGEGPCNQFPTRDPTTGEVVEVTASGGYMVSQTGLPLASPGHMRGLTLQRLFQQVLATGAPNLFMSSFNEHIGGRQAPATGSNLGFNQVCEGGGEGLWFTRQGSAAWAGHGAPRRCAAGRLVNLWLTTASTDALVGVSTTPCPVGPPVRDADRWPSALYTCGGNRCFSAPSFQAHLPRERF